MRILGLDTTRKSAIIFVVDNDNNIVKILDEKEKQSENLMINIDNLLNENNIDLKSIDCFAVVEGPGSFTGIRVGMATIKAMAFALSKPIISFNIFELMAGATKKATLISDCTASSVYYCDIDNFKIKEVGVEEKTNIDRFDNKIMLKEEHLSEEEAYKYNVLIINEYLDLVFNKVKAAFKNNDFSSSPEPYYVQLSQAERNLEKKND